MTQGVGMECFLETGKTVIRFPTIHLCKSEVILIHLCDNFSLWLWTLGLISWHGKQNQRFCHLLLQDYAWDKTTRLHIQHCYLFHNQHTKPLVYYVRIEALAKFPWTHLSSSRGRVCKNIYAFYVPPQGKRKPGRPRTSYITYIKRV